MLEMTRFYFKRRKQDAEILTGFPCSIDIFLWMVSEQIYRKKEYWQDKRTYKYSESLKTILSP